MDKLKNITDRVDLSALWKLNRDPKESTSGSLEQPMISRHSGRIKMSPDFRLGNPNSMGIRMGESSRNSGMIPLNPHFRWLEPSTLWLSSRGCNNSLALGLRTLNVAVAVDDPLRGICLPIPVFVTFDINPKKTVENPTLALKKP